MNLEFAFPRVEVWIDSESKTLTAYPLPVPTTGNSPCSGADLQKHVEQEHPKSIVDLSPFQPSTPAEPCTQVDRRGLDRWSVSTWLWMAPVSKGRATRKPQCAPQKSRKQLRKEHGPKQRLHSCERNVLRSDPFLGWKWHFLTYGTGLVALL